MYFPAGQLVHSSSVAPVLLKYLPSVHWPQVFSDRAAMLFDHLPAAQSVHWSEAALEYLPRPHPAQDFPSEVEYLPEVHSLHLHQPTTFSGPE